MSIEALVDEIRTLPVEERKRLIMLVLDTLTEPSPSVPAKRSILELAGLGADIWQGIDAQEYVDKMRL